MSVSVVAAAAAAEHARVAAAPAVAAPAAVAPRAVTSHTAESSAAAAAATPASPAPGAATFAVAPPPTIRAATVRAMFHVTAPADPGLLPRLIEPLARLGAVPTRVHASREQGDGSELTIDLRLSAVTPRVAELVGIAFRAIVGVRQVIAVVEPEA